MLYLWLKASHVIAVIAWMAGLLYLPRLFVYHCDAPKGSAQSETFKVMERRLLKAIMNPAMITAWALGLALVLALVWQGGWQQVGWQQAGWLHGKLLLVLILSGTHGYLARHVALFAADADERTQRHWRIVNEVPTLLMIGIVILAIVKPF